MPVPAEPPLRIHSESRIHHPLDRVYAVYRDRLPEIAAYIPDVKEIVVRSREDTPQGPKLLNEWIADREIPRVARTVIRPDMLHWLDHAHWNDAARHVDWKLVIPAFPDRVKCSGRNAFFADGPTRTRVQLTGDLEINARDFPGVPSIMARKIAPIVEDFIVRLVTPNLERVNGSLERFLDEHPE